MGTLLIIKGADFSENAIDVSSDFKLLKQTDLDYAEGNLMAIAVQPWYHSVPFEKNAKITAIEFALSTADYIASSRESVIIIGSTSLTPEDENFSWPNVERKVTIDIKDLTDALVTGDIEPYSIHKVLLPTPLVVSAGEYFCYRISSKNTSTGAQSGSNRCICYIEGVSGEFGYIQKMSGTHAPSNAYNAAINLYGEEIE